MPNRLFLFKIFELTFSIGLDFIDNLIPMVYQYFIRYFFSLGYFLYPEGQPFEQLLVKSPQIFVFLTEKALP